ncbi:MAG: OmpH family outer membrane protein [Bacteroidota bacterium]|nr:OmpH family outer membrane protein [Bacteroidota bacterium]MDP3146055.1 OmpH family outer membrane protein [Bacteroidota bacterium]
MRILSLINVIGIIGIVCFLFYKNKSEKKIVYINNGELFASFKMSNESNEKVKLFEQSKQSILDSLINEIKLLNPSNDKDLIARLKSEYLSKRNVFSEDINKIKQSSTEKIANQINQYVKEFAEENFYDIVLGANGTGNIWYSKENNDVTKELIEFSNAKYDGNK